MQSTKSKGRTSENSPHIPYQKTNKKTTTEKEKKKKERKKKMKKKRFHARLF